ncbi:MAG: hypothetical protein JWM02_2296 [Frankiales bacterium]|nr:hypothetical protein [Frankiales bacterium]
MNLSSRQLADPGIVTVVEQALAESGLAANRLVLEVTETAILGETDVAVRTLTRLKDLGLRLALDDFGTGYSSLTYLRAFPVDTIKIDRSFVAGLGANDDDTSIVASLISLAAAVGVDVIAEGVETLVQKDLLRRLGCPLGQGFLWSPAVPMADVPALLDQLTRTSVVHPSSIGRPALPQAQRYPWTQPRAEVRARIAKLHKSGASLDTIAAILNADHVGTPSGKRWHRKSVARVIANTAYPEGIAP